MTLGVQLGSYHTYRDWGLRWVEPYSIDYPDAKTYTVEIPGADGVLDLTETMGPVKYNNRKMELTFEMLDADYYEYEAMKKVVASALHGKRMAVILDTDPDYYYYGRLSMAADKSSIAHSTIVITGDLEPWKIPRTSDVGNDFTWDTFEFERDDKRDLRTVRLYGPAYEYNEVTGNWVYRYHEWNTRLPYTGQTGTIKFKVTKDENTSVAWLSEDYPAASTWHDLEEGTTEITDFFIPQGGMQLQFEAGYVGEDPDKSKTTVDATIELSFPRGEL